MESNEQIYLKYLDVLKTGILDAYERSGRKASGDYGEELSTETTETSMALYGASHSVYVEKGREPGKFPPINAIKDWIDVKQGLPAVFREKKDQYAFLIARKIANEGTNGTNILEAVFQDFIDKELPTMLDELGQAYYVRIQNEIVSLIKTFK